MNGRPVSVLFISAGNSARSQMAEAFLREMGGDGFEAHSAGSVTHEVHPLAVLVMAERGIDISHQRSKGLREYIGAMSFDYVITVCDRGEKACPMFPGRAAREYWPFRDPASAEVSDEERLTRFREVREAIDACVRIWLTKRAPSQNRSPSHSPVP